ncbi:hypothetical protein J0K78_17055 [Halobacillus sp. GSS1]|uniref:DUF5659 domain-containing protein n=1 Tax=Halobacillus sp. GSS1 TaxID=2815919 RepID=UPI001A8E9DA3|nr:DUF5659 domain-containing protein [Halobacillus sp. GSS1]MBN9655987.1 hypothetical protein [Halobacillus sp. GSS1]
MRKNRKAIVSIYMADRLIKRGFTVVEVKPSNVRRGKAAFMFEDTPELHRAMSELSYRKN